jgi:hypothetical protein
MRTFGAWTLTAALLVAGELGQVRATDDEPDTSDVRPVERHRGWNPALVKMFGGDSSRKEPEKPKPEPKKEAAPAKKPATPRQQASGVDEAAAVQARERATLGRRLAILDKLKEIANNTHDNELMRHTEELEERAWTAFGQHTAYLRDGAGLFEAEDKNLDKQSGTAPAAGERSPESASYTVSGKDASSHTALKEGSR